MADAAAAAAPEVAIDDIVKDDIKELGADALERREKLAEAYLEKWSGTVILGGFVPAVFALTVVFGGQIVISSADTVCQYSISSTVGASVAVGYIYLLVYTWLFLGDDLVFPFTQTTVLMPFTSLKWVVTFFTAIAIASFVVNAVGTYGLIFGITCAGTAPTLYNFAAYIVVVYWLGFFTCVFGLVRVVLGRQLAAIVDAAGEMATDAYNTSTMGSQVPLLTCVWMTP